MKFLVSALLFISVSLTTCLFLSLLQGRMTDLAIILSWIIGISVGFFYFKKEKNQFEALNLKWSDWIFIFLFLGFCGLQFFEVCFEKNGEISSLNQNNLGDLSLHITYIKNLAGGAAFWPANTIYAAEKLHYPFGVDFFTAMFVQLGTPLTVILPVMGLTAMVFTLISLLYWGRGFAVGAFLFSGGLAGIAFFASGVLSDYVGAAAWKNIVITLFVPQRGFLLAFPIGLVLLWSWRRKFIAYEKSLPLWVEGILWGTLPLIHFHTFMFISFIFAVWTLVSKNRKEAFKIFAIAVVPATIETLFLTEGFGLAQLLWINPGWMIEKENPFLFLFQNYGFFIPLILYAVYLVLKNKNKEHALLLLPALMLYGILFFVMLAPWVWDNTKVMVWCYLLMLPTLYELIIVKLEPASKWALYVLLFFSGFISHSAYLTPKIQTFGIYRQDEVNAVCEMLEKISIDEPIATAQIYNHPVNLCGYKVIAGYGGHLWSHGIKSGPVEAQLRSLMRGDLSQAKDLNVRYLFWGPREAKDFANSTKTWESQAPIAESAWGKIYELR